MSAEDVVRAWTVLTYAMVAWVMASPVLAFWMAWAIWGRHRE